MWIYYEANLSRSIAVSITESENNTAQRKQNPCQAIKITVNTLGLGKKEINLKYEKEIGQTYLKY